MTMIERVAASIAIAQKRGLDRNGVARAAIEAMRDPPLDAQIAAMEAVLQDVLENDPPVKPQDECETAIDWMDRGFSLAKRMISGHDILVCFNGVIDQALKDEA